MGRKSVAVLDVRSYDVSLYIGERGVNNTIQFSASITEPYDGYVDGAFLSEEGLGRAVDRLMQAVAKTYPASFRTLYVGVPGEFTRLVTKDQTIGFPKRRKIAEGDLDELFEKGASELEGCRPIRATSMIYITSDNRRVVDPVGQTSASLRGLLAYFYCTDYFAEAIEKLFGPKMTIRYLPTQLAMATALISSETRDECAMFADVGALSTTAMALLGGGALEQATFPVGRMSLVGHIMEKLDVSESVAEALLSKVNLNAKQEAIPREAKTEYFIGGAVYAIDDALLIEAVKDGLDDICMDVSGFLEENAELSDSKPLYITGEGLADIRGALEHISSKRLCRVCEMISPSQPYYNKPAMSSRIALIGMAYDDNLKAGWFNRLLKGFRR